MRKRLPLVTVSLLMVLVLAISLVAIGCSDSDDTPSPNGGDNGNGASTEVFEWSFSGGIPGSPQWTVMEDYVAKLEEASNGRLVVRLHAMGSISAEISEMDALNEGILDMLAAPISNALSKVPTASLFFATVGGPSHEALRVWYSQGGGNELLAQAFAEAYPNIYIVGEPHELGPEVWGYSKTPIETVDDISGLRMRCLGDAGEMFTRMGASVVFLPYGEIYESLERGTLDFTEFCNIKDGWDFGFQEICQYVYFSSSRAPSCPQILAVNKDSYNALPDDLKELLHLWGTALSKARFDVVAGQEAEALANLRDFGCEVLRVPEEVEAELLRQAQIFYEEKCAEDPFFAEVYQSLMDFKESYEGVQEIMK